ncbi:ABC transporter substrate-binding protein [Bradyrhizobium sp. cir1]|uniref:ABC transporter substrate-binding protein n=1 Tax=Bradyrhizobium sp. cir1 TaxID=1445730 RepID=UPI001AEDA6EF|nr:ABC transporter substrate-binding protein [Bradyrhizobium sp. cir1]
MAERSRKRGGWARRPFAEARDDQLPALATDLVGRKVDVIVSFGGGAPRAAKAASRTIPIVFAIGGALIAIGLVASLARPGGNVTGVSWLGGELTSKRLELMSELVPDAKSIALLVNPNNPQTRMVREMQEAAISYGASLTAAYRQVGIYAGKILKGSKPADLPVQQSTIFELVVNLKTAKALGLTIPPSILSRADEVIE